MTESPIWDKPLKYDIQESLLLELMNEMFKTSQMKNN